MTSRVALYARYSDDRQNERSIADQLGVLTAHVGRRGWTIAGVFTDAAISASAMANRPGLLSALDAAQRGEYDLLLVEDEDRIARNLEHLAHVANRLEDAGAAIATLASDKVEGMMIALKGGMGQDFLRNLSAKTKRGMASNADKGLATGSRLYGYRSQPGGAVEIVPEQAQVIRRIFALYADDCMTTRQIAALLNAEGIASPAGGMWNASTISGSKQRANGVLHSEIYAGVKVYGRVEMRKDRQTGRRVTICHPPESHTRVEVPQLRIIDDGLWLRAHARIAGNTGPTQATRKRPTRRPYLLSGLVFCGCCGAGYAAQGMNRLACAGYREKGPVACTNRRHVNRTDVERRVLKGLRERLLSPAAVAAYARTYHQAWEAEAQAARSRRAPTEKRLAEVGRAIERGVDAIFNGTGDVTAIGSRLRGLEAEQADLRQILDRMDASAPPPIQLHPRAADLYVRRVEALQALMDGPKTSASPQEMDVAMITEVRDLIQRIEITPESHETRAPYAVNLIGDLARLLAPAGGETHVGGRLVAGGGLEQAPNIERVMMIRA